MRAMPSLRWHSVCQLKTDPINVINDPLFTYTRARIPVYPPEKKL